MRVAEPPAWRFERQAAPFRVECPVCGAVTRPWWVGGNSAGLVRCFACNAKFEARAHTVPGRGRA